MLSWDVLLLSSEEERKPKKIDTRKKKRTLPLSLSCERKKERNRKKFVVTLVQFFL